MRFLLLLLLLVPVAAHPGEDAVLLPPGSFVDHTQWIERSLEPGEVNDTQLAFGGGAFQEGWFMLWYGHVDGAIEARLLHDGAPFVAWDWNGAVASETRILEAGLITLRLTNTGDANATVRVYYDQTCKCSAKQVRGSGPLWFNLDAHAGDDVDLDFLIVAVQPFGATPPRGNVTVHVDRAVHEAGLWPDGFRLVGSYEGSLEEKTLAFSMPFTAEADGTQYFRMRIDHDGNQTWSFQVKPVWTIEEKQVPAPLFPLLVLVAVALRRR